MICKRRLLPFFFLLAILTTFLIIRFTFPRYICGFPYLGERRRLSVGNVIDYLLNITKCSTVDRGSEFRMLGKEYMVYVKCKFINAKISFPRYSNERLELKIYPQRVSDYMKVWSTTINVTFNLPENISQGVYKIPKSVGNPYYFKITPGLPVRVRIHNPVKEDLDRYFILIVIRLNINGEQVSRDPSMPGVLTFIFIDCRCIPGYSGEEEEGWSSFDIVSSELTFLSRKTLEYEGLKPLMKLKGTVNVTFTVEVYVEKPLLDRNFYLDILVRPPYIMIYK